MPKSNSQLYDEAEAALYGRAIAETEREVHESAFDTLIPDDNDYDRELEMAEGIDGLPITDEEIGAFHAGHPAGRDGFDRVYAAEDDEEMADQLENTRAQLQETQRHNQELARIADQALNGPQRQAQLREQMRDQLYRQYGVLGTDERVDALAADMARQQAHAEQMQTNFANRSMAEAHSRYGGQFEKAYRSFTSMDPQNPTAQALARDVMGAADPGERLMALHEGGVRGLSRGGGNDFRSARGLAGVRDQAPRGRFPVPREMDRGNRDGWGSSPSEEREIADSVWE